MVISAYKDRSPLLFTGAGIICGAALVILAIVPGTITHHIRSFFPDGPYMWVALATAVVLLASLLLHLTATLVGWRFQPEESVLLSSGASIDETISEVRARLQALAALDEPDVSGALDLLLQGGLALSCSDIHLNPLGNEVRVDYRIDGVLYGVSSLPGHLGPRFSQRLKVLSHLDTFAKTPQDGVLRRAYPAGRVEARVSVLPANHGERVVLRLVKGGEAVVALDQLGLDDTTRRHLTTTLDKPQGLLFVSGPVGSGKTTTLYSSLRYLHESRGRTTSIMTLEDPIELQLPFCTQTQINPKVGMTFAQTLRTVLRQDPGALMVGEIRDRETAQIATQAGLTGHLILTTVHVESAAGVFTRLMEMDVEPYVLSSATVGALSQRLVRGLCGYCKEVHTPTTEERLRLEALGAPVGEGTFYVPVGCENCGDRGFDGRLVIVEFLQMTDEVRQTVGNRCSTEEIHRCATSAGMVPLVQQGLRLAASGQTSLSEVLRVAG